VEAKIARAASLGCEMVVLSGGEPTIRPELSGWAGQIRELGMGFGLVSNGRMLAYDRHARGLQEAGLAYAQLSLHGGDAALHNGLTRTDSFEQTLSAIRNLNRPGMDLTVNAVVTSANLDRLGEMVDLLSRDSGLRLKFSMVEPKGAALERFDELMPDITAVAARVREAIVYAQARAPGLRLAHEGIPLCLLGGLEQRASDLRLDGFAWISEAHEAGFFPVDAANKERVDACGRCEHQGICTGIYQEYLYRRGDPGLGANIAPGGLRAQVDLQHEEMSREERHWVRVTRSCNNRCAFCLDDADAGGAMAPEQEVLDDIARGRARGADRLILSGGEATIHPDFVRFIRAGRGAGYGHIQVVTNGRMFSYPNFLDRSLVAGLDEITFSIHGPDAPLHDALVGVPGAFEQTVKALRLALATGRLIVSVDVCLNRLNIEHLPRLLERFIAMGVSEFDLLQVIPFGRAFAGDRAHLTYDLQTARPHLDQALEISRRPGIHIWFNRFPAPHLEGHEHLIQDPYKLHDEVRGRGEEFEALLQEDHPLRCRQPGRCACCYLRGLCDSLEQWRGRLARQDFDVFRVNADAGPGLVCRPPWPMDQLWVCGLDVEQAVDVIGRGAARRAILELGSYSGLSQTLDRGGRIEGRELSRVYVSKVEDLDAVLSLHGSFEVVAYLSVDMAQYLSQSVPCPPPRLVLARRNHARASGSRQWDADLPRFFTSNGRAWFAVEDIPQCISGQAPRPGPRVLDAVMLRSPAGEDPGAAPQLDIQAFTDLYILHLNYSKSLRCEDCSSDHTCGGVQLNYLRAHGYRTLQPIKGSAGG